MACQATSPCCSRQEPTRRRAGHCDATRGTSLVVDNQTAPFSFVKINGVAELIDDVPTVRRWATVLGGRYMGSDRAEEFGARNGVPGELLVRVTPTKIIAVDGEAD